MTTRDDPSAADGERRRDDGGFGHAGGPVDVLRIQDPDQVPTTFLADQVPTTFLRDRCGSTGANDISADPCLALRSSLHCDRDERAGARRGVGERELGLEGSAPVGSGNSARLIPEILSGGESSVGDVSESTG